MIIYNCSKGNEKKREGKLLKTRKGIDMTKKEALTAAMNALTDNEAKTVIEKMIAQLSKSPDAVKKANDARKEKTASARAELVAKVAPILREALTHTLHGVTAKELFDLTKQNLPEDFTAPKVQNILLREMREELNITEAKGKANVYTLKSVVQ